MFKKSGAIILQMLCICGFLASAQTLRSEQEMFSPTAAMAFYDIAHELANSESEKTQVTRQQAEQALVFLSAASQLDNQADYFLPDLIKMACRFESPLSLGLADVYGRTVDPNDPTKFIEPKDNSQLIVGLLAQYVNQDSDLQVVREAIQYLLSRLDVREQREQMLLALLTRFRKKNDVLESELYTSVGILTCEKADYDNAQSLFLAAIGKNKYNRLAVEELYRLAGEKINPAGYLEHLRYNLGENPLDLQAAIAFASRAQQLELFQTAANAYEYCLSLFEYLYPNEPLPQYIYLPWALSLYNSARNPHKIVEIAQRVQNDGTFDIMLETVGAKAAEKTGDIQLASDMLNKAQQTAKEKYQLSGVNRAAIAQQLAWFYCFGKVVPADAIDWANRAYAAEPNNPNAAALLAYAFVINDQHNWAKPFFETYQPGPILNLAKAQVQLSDANNTGAIESLKSVIVSAPESLEAQKARQLLRDVNSVYVPAVDPELILSALEDLFGQSVVPVFREPNEIFDAKLKIRGDKFAYGSDFRSSVIITNKSTEPIIISENGLLSGNIRIDAKVSGDLSETIPELVSMQIQPSQPINPGSTLIVPVNLRTGSLEEILKQHPQAALKMEFTLYLDSVTLPDGSVANRLEDITPATISIERSAVNLTAQFLRSQLSSLKRRRQSQNTAQLFAGLLMEEHIMANREPTYPYKYSDWMPDLLESGLVYNLANDVWISRIYTMKAMLGLPLNFDLLETASENLTNENWPVRLMTLYLLAENQTSGFDRVLDYTAKYDQEKLVRDMALALGGTAPKTQELSLP
jgi:hypothetical protein